MSKTPNYNLNLIPDESIDWGGLARENYDIIDTELDRIDEAVDSHLAEDVTDAHGFVVEKGTWTPEYLPQNGSFEAVQYSWQTGNYVKQGNLVLVECTIATDNNVLNIGSASGRLDLTGLPFFGPKNEKTVCTRVFRFNTGGEVLNISAQISGSSVRLIKELGPNNPGGPPNLSVSEMETGGTTFRNALSFDLTYEI